MVASSILAEPTGCSAVRWSLAVSGVDGREAERGHQLGAAAEDGDAGDTRGSGPSPSRDAIASRAASQRLLTA
jgi:hypothetical protein